MVANARLAEVMGVGRERVLLCEDGDVIELSERGLDPVGRVPAGYLYVDGIVGDVGQGVLRDRQKLAEEGVVVVVVTVDVQTCTMGHLLLLPQKGVSLQGKQLWMLQQLSISIDQQRSQLIH